MVNEGLPPPVGGAILVGDPSRKGPGMSFCSLWALYPGWLGPGMAGLGCRRLLSPEGDEPRFRRTPGLLLPLSPPMG